MTQLKILCSYAYFRTTDMGNLAADATRPGHPPMILGDSGAHSARTLGIHITLDDYAQWCHTWDKHLTLYANLDVIRAPAATWANQQALHARGLTPLPVFHTGEPWHWLHRYLDAGYTYIALGKLLGHPPKHVLPWLEKVFRTAEGRAVFHGFGMTVWQALKEFPFYSVDSSSWGQSFRFGQVVLFDRGRWVKFLMRDRPSVLKHRELIRAHGIAPAAFASKATYDRAGATRAAATAWLRAEAWLRAYHGPITVPPSPHNPLRGRDPGPGLHLYLAETTTTNIRRAADAAAQLREA